MTTIYYVDPTGGSDTAGDGQSWATAWETTQPLLGVYATALSVSDVEVRFAKSVPYATDRSITLSAYSDEGFVAQSVEAGSGAKRKCVGVETHNKNNEASVRGAVMNTALFEAELLFGPERQHSVGHTRFRSIAAHAQGHALRWTHTTPLNLSSFHCLEFVATAITAPRRDATSYPTFGTITLCSDEAGTNVLWSRTFQFGGGKDDAALYNLGNGDLPDGVRSTNLSVSTTPDGVATITTYSISNPYAVHAPETPNYEGLRRMHVCTTGDGHALTPILFIGDTVSFGGFMNKGYDAARAARGLSTRKYDSYYFRTLPPTHKSIMPMADTLGTAVAPVKFTGGWNTTTGVVDGITVMDAANLQTSNTNPRVWHTEFSNLALAFHRGVHNLTLGGFEERCICSKSINESLEASARFSNIHVPAASSANVSLIPAFYSTICASEAIVRAKTPASIGQEPQSPVRVFIDGCSSGYSPIFSGWPIHADSRTTNSYLSFSYPPVNHPDIPLTGLTLVDIKDEFHKRFKGCNGCKVISSTQYGRTPTAPVGPYVDCEFWGPMTAGSTEEGKATDCTYYPYLTADSGPLSKHVWAKNLRVDLGADANTTIFNYNGPLSYVDGASAGAVTLEDTVLPMIYYSLTRTGSSISGGSIYLDNVTLRWRTGAATAVINTPYSVTARNLTLDGNWAAFISGVCSSADVVGLICTSTATKVHTNYAYPSSATGWGRVACSFLEISHPSGFAGVLGSAMSATSGYAGGAVFGMVGQTPQWISSYLIIERDFTNKVTGASSWKMTTRANMGSATSCGHMLGLYMLAQGQTVRITARMRRSHALARGAIYIQPLDTKIFQYTGSASIADLIREVMADQPLDTPPGSWDHVELVYTAERSGLAEFYFGMRGPNGSSVWIDDVKVS